MALDHSGLRPRWPLPRDNPTLFWANDMGKKGRGTGHQHRQSSKSRHGLLRGDEQAVVLMPPAPMAPQQAQGYGIGDTVPTTMTKEAGR